jgi:uncharacterized protein YcfJ
LSTLLLFYRFTVIYINILGDYMKLNKKISVLFLSLLAMSAFANEFTDFARVRKVEPQYTMINQPRETCYNEVIREQVPHYNERRGSDRGGNDRGVSGGAVIGGIAGGLLGNQVGGGDGKVAATALGAVIGAFAGDNIDNNNNNNNRDREHERNYSTTQEREVRRCKMEDNHIQSISGYNVEYEYKGQINSFISPVAPQGDRIKVKIQITPVIGY